MVRGFFQLQRGSLRLEDGQRAARVVRTVVGDPAVSDPLKGKLVYKRADMQTVWLDRGGTAYVLTGKR